MKSPKTAEEMRYVYGGIEKDIETIETEQLHVFCSSKNADDMFMYITDHMHKLVDSLQSLENTMDIFSQDHLSDISDCTELSETERTHFMLVNMRATNTLVGARQCVRDVMEMLKKVLGMLITKHDCDTCTKASVCDIKDDVLKMKKSGDCTDTPEETIDIASFLRRL